MTEPSAKVIADSVNTAGDRLTTMEVVMHRFVLSEFNTHRALSRCSASSRAIPVSAQIQKVLDDPAIPLVWPSEKSGMVGGEPLVGEALSKARSHWMEARMSAINTAERMTSVGVHKSIVNRVLEPFMWHTVVVSATEWDNFWELRISPLAQPEMMAAAKAMKVAYDASEPNLLLPGDWHKPYVVQADYVTVDAPQNLLAVSAARCGRVSYGRQGDVKDLKEDLARFESFAHPESGPPHASPLEHVATTCACDWQPHRGNFVGFDQLRHMVLDGKVLSEL